MVKSEVVMLMNYSAGYEDIVVLSIKKCLLENGSDNDELKKLIRDALTDLFGGEFVSIEEYFNYRATAADVEKCVESLVKGEDYGFAGEHLWWSEPLEVVTAL
jgi:hypothetical protein